jgi:hypothetical protein
MEIFMDIMKACLWIISVLDVNLDSCWYSLDGGVNVSLPGCANTTIDVSEDNHTLVVYANDTLGFLGSSSVDFGVVVGSPTIFLISPADDSYQNNESGIYTFRYRPEDIDLDSCELWGGFNGTFVLNQTDTGVVSGVESSFSVFFGRW